MVDPGSSRNTILDSGTDTEVIADRALNAVRATPTVGS
jgi:inulin fructotransferase (DFA-I-forming)